MLPLSLNWSVVHIRLLRIRVRSLRLTILTQFYDLLLAVTNGGPHFKSSLACLVVFKAQTMHSLVNSFNQFDGQK